MERKENSKQNDCVYRLPTVTQNIIYRYFHGLILDLNTDACHCQYLSNLFNLNFKNSSDIM